MKKKQAPLFRILSYWPLVIYYRLLRPNGLALYPFIFVSVRKPSAKLINHERIHLQQELELGIVLFYIIYLAEYAYNCMRYKSRYYAYRKISFEQEAYTFEDDLEYLKTRKWGASFRFWFR